MLSNSSQCNKDKTDKETVAEKITVIPCTESVSKNVQPFMNANRLKISAILTIVYQYFFLKKFPFIPKDKAIDLILKYCGKNGANVAVIFTIQIVFRAALVYLFEKIYKVKSLDLFKSQPDKEWFFNKEPKTYEKLRKKTYRGYFTKIVPVLLLLLPVSYKYGNKARVDKKFPSIYEMFYQINASLFLTDIAFYLVHRFFFHSKKYYYLHKDHHSYINTTAHASLRMSLLDYFLEVIIPGMIGPTVFKMHIFTYILYIISGNVIGIMSHAGYIFPFKPLSMQFPINELFGTSNNIHHEIHHNIYNANYSAVSFLPDMFSSTQVTAQELQDKKRKK